MNAVYIGRRFYTESGTRMSSVYEEVANHYERTDWGFIQSRLDSGEEVYIRPATPQEIFQFDLHLAEIKGE